MPGTNFVNSRASRPPAAGHYCGSQICSGRPIGAGRKSRAWSTTWRIRENHHWGLRGGRVMFALAQGVRSGEKPSSICPLPVTVV